MVAAEVENVVPLAHCHAPAAEKVILPHGVELQRERPGFEPIALVAGLVSRPDAEVVAVVQLAAEWGFGVADAGGPALCNNGFLSNFGRNHTQLLITCLFSFLVFRDIEVFAKLMVHRQGQLLLDCLQEVYTLVPQGNH